MLDTCRICERLVVLSKSQVKDMEFQEEKEREDNGWISTTFCFFCRECYEKSNDEYKEKWDICELYKGLVIEHFKHEASKKGLSAFEAEEEDKKFLARGKDNVIQCFKIEYSPLFGCASYTILMLKEVAEKSADKFIRHAANVSGRCEDKFVSFWLSQTRIDKFGLKDADEYLRKVSGIQIGEN